MRQKKCLIGLHLSVAACNLADVTDRRVPAEAIATSIAVSGASVAGVEKAAGMHRGELRSYLNGGDLEARELVHVGGLLGVSPVDLYREETRG